MITVSKQFRHMAEKEMLSFHKPFLGAEDAYFHGLGHEYHHLVSLGLPCHAGELEPDDGRGVRVPRRWAEGRAWEAARVLQFNSLSLLSLYLSLLSLYIN